MNNNDAKTTAAFEALAALHVETDARFAATTNAIGVPIGCRPGCAACCQDGLRVWQVEADAIERLVVAQIASGGAPPRVRAPGACAFLSDDQRCQVFAARPYVCRSQGAVLGWVEDDDDGDELSRRATCEVHLVDVDLMALPSEAEFTIGPAEHQLVAIATQQLALAGAKGLPKRVPLRSVARKLARLVLGS
jgi:uncharacterized protein